MAQHGYVIAAGNPVIWAAAFVAIGTIGSGAAVFTLVKPSLAPFALLGVRSRVWWLVALIISSSRSSRCAVIEICAVLRNARLDLLYSIGHIPIMLIPVVAWLTSGRERYSPKNALARFFLGPTRSDGGAPTSRPTPSSS